MGCNAWNHSLGCQCGWGGATGGSGGGTGRWVFSRALSGGPSRSAGYAKQWGFSRRGLGEGAYVNPNASCPVCGAAVFFYEAPNGGRVFFDELGHPWPKHPCTSSDDNLKRNPAGGAAGSAADEKLAARKGRTPYPEPAPSQSPPRSPAWRDAHWMPLYEPIWGVWTTSQYDPPVSRLLGKLGPERRAFSAAVLVGTALDLQAPLFVKPHGEPGWWWIDEPRLEAPQLVCAMEGARFQDESLANLAVAARHSETLCALARRRSFDQPEHSLARDLTRARTWFRAAARLGDETAFYGLGRIYEHGLGVEPSLARARSYYRKAARGGEALYVRALKRCVEKLAVAGAP